MSKRKDWERSANIKLIEIDAITEGQAHALMSDKNLVLYGVAGTGKTFISMYIALKELFAKQYDQLVIIRSAVPSRDMGFLPGNIKEKSNAYETPYIEICTELFGRGDAYGILSTKGAINFITNSFLRGRTLNNCIVIVDECQNYTEHELDSIITRVGENTRIIFCGDHLMQSDLNNDRSRQESGLEIFIRTVNRMKEFELIEYGPEDIVRSGLVKSYILSKLKELR